MDSSNLSFIVTLPMSLQMCSYESQFPLTNETNMKTPEMNLARKQTYTTPSYHNKHIATQLPYTNILVLCKWVLHV